MAALLNKRAPIAAAVALVLGLAMVLTVAALRSADAQTEPTFTEFLFTESVSAVNGFVTFDESGLNQGVVYAACSGAAPRSGGNIPAQVVSNVTANTTSIRILHNNGTPLTGTVDINCSLLVEDEVTPTLQRKFPSARVVGVSR
jgi:hypothetical protein